MRALAVVLLLAVLAAAPLALDRGLLFLASEMLVIIAMAQAWNLLAGYGGLVSLGNQGFVGLGGYALYIATRDLGLHPWLAIPVAGLATAGAALVLAPILFRLRAAYFAVGMWVAAEIIRIAMLRLDTFGGSTGLPLAAARNIGRDALSLGGYWLALFLAAGATLLVWMLMRGGFGLRLRALRDDELAARSAGVSPRRVRLAVFLISAAITGLAGAVHFLSVLFITPVAAFDMTWMVTIVFVTLIGGLSRLSGPILGALLFFALRETLAFSSSWYLVALGAVAVLVVILVPDGLAGLADRGLAALRRHALPRKAKAPD